MKAKAAGDRAPEMGAHLNANRLDGWWWVQNQLLPSSADGFKPLRLGYRLQLKQDGQRVTGRGERWTENGRSISPDARTPITVVGRLDGRNLALRFTEPSAPGSSGGTFILILAGDGVLRGSFTAARLRGSSIAWRMR